jgi:hypothetical protein
MTSLTELAKQCGAEVREYEGGYYSVQFGEASLPEFVERIREEEREKAAKVCEATKSYTNRVDAFAHSIVRHQCAAVIREASK